MTRPTFLYITAWEGQQMWTARSDALRPAIGLRIRADDILVTYE